MTRRALHLIPLLLIVGCAAAPPESVTERDTRAACRRQAEEVYRLRHRDQIYSVPSQDAPQSGAIGLPLPTTGLADQFEQEREINTCVHDTGTGTALKP
ncbi:MAG TPA: hypothetical protein VNE67_01850 [Acetobacteraceae bacterium]|nr:hypothetical protein [Acetobacteraceae bacterium]